MWVFCSSGPQPSRSGQIVDPIRVPYDPPTDANRLTLVAHPSHVRTTYSLVHRVSAVIAPLTTIVGGGRDNDSSRAHTRPARGERIVVGLLQGRGRDGVGPGGELDVGLGKRLAAKHVR